MISGAEVLAGVLVPAGAAVVLGLGARLLPARSSAAWAGAALLLAAGAGHAAMAFTAGQSLNPARNGFQGIFWAQAMAALVLLVPAGLWLRAGLVAVATGLGWWLAMAPLIPHSLPLSTALPLAAILVLGTVGVGAALEALGRRQGCSCGLSGPLLSLVCAAATITAAGSVVLGQYAGVAAAAAGGLLISWIRTGRAAPGVGWATAILLGLHAGANLLYSDLTRPAAVLIVLAPLAAWLAQLSVLRRHPKVQVVLRLALVAAVAGGALAYTVLAGQPAALASDPGGFAY